jgi:hypothetical protein
MAEPIIYVRTTGSSCIDRENVTINEEEWIFMRALDDYKRLNDRLFPTWREVLAVAHSLGYRKTEAPTALPKCVSRNAKIKAREREENPARFGV